MGAGDTLFSSGSGNLQNTWTAAPTSGGTSAGRINNLTFTAGADPTTRNRTAATAGFVQPGMQSTFAQSDTQRGGSEYIRARNTDKQALRNALGNFQGSNRKLDDIVLDILRTRDERKAVPGLSQQQKDAIHAEMTARANTVEQLGAKYGIGNRWASDFKTGRDDVFDKAFDLKSYGQQTEYWDPLGSAWRTASVGLLAGAGPTGLLSGIVAGLASGFADDTIEDFYDKIKNEGGEKFGVAPGDEYKAAVKAFEDFKAAQTESINLVNTLYSKEFKDPEYKKALDALLAKFPDQAALEKVIGPEAAQQAFKDKEAYDGWAQSETSRQATTNTANTLIGQQQGYLDDINQIFTDPYNAEGMQDFVKYANTAQQTMDGRDFMSQLYGADRASRAAQGGIEDMEFKQYMGAEQRASQNEAALGLVNQMNTALTNADTNAAAAIKTQLLNDKQSFDAYTQTLLNNLTTLGAISEQQRMEYTTKLNEQINAYRSAAAGSQAQRDLENAIFQGILTIGGTLAGLPGGPGTMAVGAAAGGAASATITALRNNFDPATRLRINRRQK